MDWVDLSGFSVPAAYAGGDFYDWLCTPEGSVVLALGDVSGHGVGPALIAAECRAYWRGLAQSLTLRDAVMRLNELVLDDLSGERFVTLVAAKLSRDGNLEVFSAGHGPQVIRRLDGAVELLGPQTFPLGVTSKLPGVEATVRGLTSGDTLLMFSDGMTETRNPERKLWTADGLLKGLARHGGLCGSDLLREIDQENLAFAAGEPPVDDRTALVATFRGK
jgi:serine phosphatase RsbU (regulator of sigma subunit)